MVPRGKGQQAVNADMDTNADLEHIMSIAEVEAEASLRSSRIHGAHTSLAFILSRYEETIRKRWHKKDHRKRHTVLLSAYPKMPTRYRPDPDLFNLRQHKAVHRGQAFMDAYPSRGTCAETPDNCCAVPRGTGPDTYLDTQPGTQPGDPTGELTGPPSSALPHPRRHRS